MAIRLIGYLALVEPCYLCKSALKNSPTILPVYAIFIHVLPIKYKYGDISGKMGIV